MNKVVLGNCSDSDYDGKDHYVNPSLKKKSPNLKFVISK